MCLLLIFTQSTLVNNLEGENEQKIKMTSLPAPTSARSQRFCLIDRSFVAEITPEKTVFNVNQTLIKGVADSGGFFCFHIIRGSFVWSCF